MKIDITPAQLRAIQSLTSDCASILQCREDEEDPVWTHHIKLIDRMLLRNGVNRSDKKTGNIQ